MIEKVKQIALEKYGKELTDEQATEYAKKYGKLSDDELDNVAGGSCIDNTCPKCGANIIHGFRGSMLNNSCQNCGYDGKD